MRGKGVVSVAARRMAWAGGVSLAALLVAGAAGAQEARDTSVLRKIGINPHLVLVPGHMLLGFDLDAGGRQRAYLETTRLGSVPRRAPAGAAGPMAAMAGDVDEERSLQSFEAAVELGSDTVEAAGDRFDDPRAVEYRLVDIAAARRRGVMPIAAP